MLPQFQVKKVKKTVARLSTILTDLLIIWIFSISMPTVCTNTSDPGEGVTMQVFLICSVAGAPYAIVRYWFSNDQVHPIPMPRCHKSHYKSLLLESIQLHSAIIVSIRLKVAYATHLAILISQSVSMYLVDVLVGKNKSQYDLLVPDL